MIVRYSDSECVVRNVDEDAPGVAVFCVKADARVLVAFTPNEHPAFGVPGAGVFDVDQSGLGEEYPLRDVLAACADMDARSAVMASVTEIVADAAAYCVRVNAADLLRKIADSMDDLFGSGWHELDPPGGAT